MTLQEYIDRHELKQNEFAMLLGVKPQLVSRYLRGRVPETDILRRIAEVTDGQVTPNDFILPKAACAGGGVAADAAA